MKLVFATIGIFAVDTIPTEFLDPIAKLGATAALVVIIIWLITKTLPAKDKEFTSTIRAIAEQQHNDSVKLNSTLTEMRSACAVVQASITKK